MRRPHYRVERGRMKWKRRINGRQYNQPRHPWKPDVGPDKPFAASTMRKLQGDDW